MSDDIEKDFESVSAQINLKLKEAAEAIREASRLSKEFGLKGALIVSPSTHDLDFDLSIDEEEYDPEGLLETLFDMIDVQDLEEALNYAGWSTSSSYC